MNFGIDLSNPTVQQFILQGGAVIVALAFLTLLGLALINAFSSKDKSDGEVMQLLVKDMRGAIDRSAVAQETSNELVRELKEYIKEDGQRRDRTLILIDHRLTGVEHKVDSVLTRMDIQNHEPTP